jgi:hypothetical protein
MRIAQTGGNRAAAGVAASTDQQYARGTECSPISFRPQFAGIGPFVRGVAQLDRHTFLPVAVTFASFSAVSKPGSRF